ncbi:MAG: arginine--tRNA ligase [Patescibacteria group bacterium]|jgi:arginyl-tRNA synthetase
MSTRDKAILDIVKALKKAIGKGYTVHPDIFEVPPNSKYGDIAFPCFDYAKGLGRNPAEIASELAAHIGPTDYIETITAAGPYVNFTFSLPTLTEQVIKEILKLGVTYGCGTSGEGKSILVDYAQPNTHKEFHIGHVRNAVLGQSIINILRANGFHVVGASYIGDIGAHVAKVIWAMEKFHHGESVPKDQRTKWLGEVYTQATAYVDAHEEAKEEIALIQRKLEGKEEPYYSQWKETREWSLTAFREAFKELHVHPDVWYFESDVEGEGKEIVKKMLIDGLAKKSQGAVVMDLAEENLGIFLLLKSDGGALYSTKEIALILRKQKDHHPDRQLMVVDVRQSLYFQQVFATLHRMGFTQPLTHIAYDMVTLPEGAMSSRSGNVVTFEALRDDLVNSFQEETKKRHPEWTEKKVEETARALAIASMIFMMQRQDSQTIITFDREEALSFDGFTGPYLLYTVARIASLRKNTKIKPKGKAGLLTHEKEYALIRHLARFPDEVQKAGITFQISTIALWAFELAKLFAEYYHEVHVIDEEQKERTAARLMLCDAVRIALENALRLLCIEPIEEM